MKLRTLPFFLAVVAPFAMADGPIDGSVYGKINLSMDTVDLESTGEDEWQLNSNASRFGVKGETKLSDTLSAIYKIEWEVSIDGESSELKSRNRYIGLTGGFGTIIGGKHDTPTKLAQKKIDLFNDLDGDIKHTFEGENRVNDIVMYTTPSMGAFSATLGFAPSEGELGGDDKAGEAGDDGIADGISMMAEWNLDKVYLAAAMDQDIDGQDLQRLVGQFTFGKFQLGVMFQANENDNSSKDETGYFVSGSLKVGKNGKLKAQIGSIEDDADNDEEETFSVGYDHKLGKNTKWFAYLTQNTDTSTVTEVGIVEQEDTTVGFGLEHKF